MIACPNKNSKEYKDLLAEVGESRIMLEWNKRYNWSESKTNPNKALKRLLKLYNAQKGKFIPLGKDGGTLQNLRRDIREVNKNFLDKKIIYKLTSDSKSAMLYIVDKKESESLFDNSDIEFKRDINYYNGDQALMEQEESQNFSEGDLRSLDEVQDQIEFLKAKFNAVVLEDNTMEESGKVLAKSDPLTKQYGKPVIKINPNKLFSDTVIHEFGHIFIDMIGGMSNTRIKAARAKLNGSKIESDIIELYPELDGERLDKEIVATALGLEGSQIWNNTEKQSWWNRFTEWFFEFIEKLTGQSRNELKSLAKDLISEQIVQGEISDYVQSKKVKLDEKIKTQEQLVNEAASIVELRLGSQKRFNSRMGKKATEEGKSYENELESLHTELKDLQDKDAKLAMLKFADYVLNSSEHSLIRLKEKIAEGTVTSEYLMAIDNYFGAFENVADKANEILNDSEIQKAFTEASNVLNQLIKERNKIIKSEFSKRMAQKSTKVESKYRNNFQKEANNLGLKGEEKDKYIIEKLLENKNNILQEEINIWNEYFEEGAFDMGYATASLKDPKSLNSQVIQLVSVILDEGQQKTRNQFMNSRKNFIDEFLEFKKANSGINPEQMYKGLYQQDEDGNYYLTSPYKAEYYNQNTELYLAQLEAEREYGLDSKEYKEANNKFKAWRKANVKAGKPIDKWKNPAFSKLNKFQLKFIAFLRNDVLAQDGKLPKGSRLNKDLDGTYFVKLPSVTKSTFEMMSEGKVKELMKLDKYTKKQADDTEFGSTMMKGDASNHIQRDVPIYYRGKVNPKDQSLDLGTIFLMNNYTSTNYYNMKNVAPTVELILEASAQKLYFETKGINKEKITNLLRSDKSLKKPFYMGNEYQALKSTIENRLYGIKAIEAGDFLGMDINKLSGAIAGYTGNLMLSFNFPAAIVNTIQGKISQIIETTGNKYLKNFFKGEQLFWKDFTNIMTEQGTVNQNSKTQLLLDKFKGLSDFKILQNEFAKDSRLKALLSKSNLGFMMNGSEYYQHASVMYAVLSSIKVMNAKREYIDSKGNVVSKSKAMTLAEAYTVKDGKLELNSNVKHNEFDIRNTHDSIEGQTSITNLIGDTKADLFGQYDSEMNSILQRYWFGKAIMMFRKFIIRGFDRRWRSFKYVKDDNDDNTFYSEATKEFKEGYYTSTTRLIVGVYKGMKELGFNLQAAQGSWDSLSDYQKGNVMKAVTEFGFIALALFASLALKELGDDESNEDFQTRIYWSAFFTRRLYSELAFFANPRETFRILRNPAVSLSVLENVVDVFEQGFSDLLHLEIQQYETGIRKGTYKLKKDVQDLVPLLKFADYKVREKMQFYY
jgi:hypothetical protein